MPKLERQIRKKWDECLPDIKIFFEKMKDKDDPVNPLKYLDESEMYFQSLVIWKETKEELYLPTKKFKPTRHKKVLGTAN